MQSSPPLPAMCGAPRLPASWFPRARLDRLRDGWHDLRLVLVYAGAGFGKTSFLAGSAAQGRSRCAWLTTGEEDADLRVFTSHLEVAICGADAGQAGSADGNDDLVGAALARMVHRLREWSDDAAIVIDDLHLGASAPVVAFLDRLVQFLPPGCTLVLASREPIGIATMKLQAEGRLARIGAAELAFDEDEVDELFRRHFPNRQLPASLRTRVLRQTEGWPAGLEIFYQGLPGGTAREVEAALESASDGRSGWFYFFAEEVLRRLDPGERSFLLRTSVLPRLEPSVCDRLLDRTGSRAMLERQCERNRFTFRTGSNDGEYRFHGLFRAFLRDLLEREEGEAAVHRLLRRAGMLLAREGMWGEAAEAYAEAGNSAEVLRIVERRAGDMIAGGRSDSIRRVLERVPGRELSRRPAALLALARAMHHLGDWEGAEALFRRALRANPKAGVRVELLAGLAQLRLNRGDPRGAVTLGREALALRGPRRVALREQVLATLGVATCELGRLDEGERYLRSAEALMRRARDRESHLRAFYLLPANIHYRRGDFRQAKEATRSALVEFRKLGDHRRTCHCLGVLGYLCAESAEVGEARDLTADSMRLADSLDYPVMLGYGRLALSRCSWIEGDGDDAWRQAEEARQIGQRLGDTGLLTISLSRLAEATLLEGKRAAARRGAWLAVETARRLGDIYEEAYACTMLGHLHGARPDGRSWWGRAERIVRRVGMRFEHHRHLLLRIDAGAVSERRIGPLITELLCGVESLGHEFLFLRLHPGPAARVLAQAVRIGREVETASRLLARLGEPAAAPVAALLGDAEDAVRSRAIEILRAIGGDKARIALVRAARVSSPTAAAAGEAARELQHVADPPLRIQTLGRFEVEIGQRRMAFGDWKSLRAARLFQVLLLHRFRWVSREVLIERLWPEAEPERGLNSLRQSLHLLRKALEPGLRAPGESMYVWSRHDGCRLEPGEDRAYDVEEFEEAVRRGDARRSAGDDVGAERSWLRAIELYGGPYLAEFPYEEYAAEERECLRDALLRTLHRLMDLLARADRWEELVPLARRGIAEDRWHEESHFRLVQALCRLGGRAEAVGAYHAYEEAMIREMELLPSARMKALAEELTAPPA